MKKSLMFLAIFGTIIFSACSIDELSASILNAKTEAVDAIKNLISEGEEIKNTVEEKTKQVKQAAESVSEAADAIEKAKNDINALTEDTNAELPQEN